MCCNHSQVAQVLNALNREIYVYFGFLTKTRIIDHYTVFHELIPIFRWPQFIWFFLSQ